MDLAAKLAAKLTAMLAKYCVPTAKTFRCYVTAKLAAKLATRVNIPYVRCRSNVRMKLVPFGYGLRIK